MLLNIDVRAELSYTIADAERDLCKAIAEQGYLSPERIEWDGRIHRFHANRDKGVSNEAGWYVAFDGDHPSAAFGSWIDGTTFTWHADSLDELSPVERDARKRQIAELVANAQAEREEEQKAVSETSGALWERLPEASGTFPYFVKKGLCNAHGARQVDETRIAVPLMDKDGRVWNMQYIASDGTKRYRKGGRTKGLFWMVGQGRPVYLCEGFATACSVYEATGKPTLMSFSAGNLKNVAQVFPGVTIIADNDESETGEREAKASGVPYILIPEVGMDANDYASAFGSEALRRLIAEKHSKFPIHSLLTCLEQRRPTSWIVKNWLPEGDSFAMIFGQSGSGKTFVILDMLLSIASGIGWGEARVKQADVLYLCGEGFQSVQNRVCAWIQSHPALDRADVARHFFYSEESCKIDNMADLNKVFASIDEMGIRPKVICTDTLIRYMEGDENDTSKANAFITACAEVQRKYDCCFLTVHHTGLGDDQKRSRGSSAFKAALDMQILVEKNRDMLTVSQTKNKNGREMGSVHFHLDDVTLEGIVDPDDGEPISCAVPRHVDRSEEKPKQEKPAQQLKDEHVAVDLFVAGGYMLMGRPYIEREQALAILTEDDGSDKAMENARKAMQVRKTQQTKPRLFERLVAYGAIEVATNASGAIAGYYANDIILEDGLCHPAWELNLKARQGGAHA